MIPAFNEERNISSVINSIPGFVDKIIVVDDKSIDNTTDIVDGLMKTNDKLVLLKHTINQGCGGAMATGYKWARNIQVDIAVRMDGDGQMDPGDFEALIAPLVDGWADYSKGNRLFTGEAFRKIPTIRYLGNGFLSLFTKIASGYWNVADSQSGYSAINKKALNLIEWDRMYKKYGQPNDVLVRLNVENLKVTDVPVKPIYNVGEKSNLKIYKAVFTISWLLIKMFLWRMKEKYIIRDFHPLVFFYITGFGFGVCTILLFLRVFIIWYLTGHIPAINTLAAMFSFTSSSLFTLFAMWFDMEANKDLKAS